MVPRMCTWGAYLSVPGYLLAHVKDHSGQAVRELLAKEVSIRNLAMVTRTEPKIESELSTMTIKIRHTDQHKYNPQKSKK